MLRRGVRYFSKFCVYFKKPNLGIVLQKVRLTDFASENCQNLVSHDLLNFHHRLTPEAFEITFGMSSIALEQCNSMGLITGLSLPMLIAFLRKGVAISGNTAQKQTKKDQDASRELKFQGQRIKMGFKLIKFRSFFE